MSTKKKYGAIVCEDADKWGGVDGCGERLINVFKEDETEEWEYFRATNNEIPNSKNLSEYQGFVISGSHYSANDTHAWIDELERFIQDVDKYQQNNVTAPKLVGICFGHQIMVKALGGKVIKNKLGRFVFGLGEIHVGVELKNKDVYKEVFEGKDSFVMFQSHGEEITDLPETARLLASSETCPNEIVAYGDNLLSFQGHMEITDEKCLNLILPSIKKAGIFNEQDEKIMRDIFEKKSNNRDKVVEMIQKYMK